MTQSAISNSLILFCHLFCLATSICSVISVAEICTNRGIENGQ
ncbi:hypothetical protein ACN4EE_21045 [Geminocystis sp. CENA526]